MSDASKIPGLSGSWFGVYYYDAGTAAHAFEAVFIEENGVVSGSILDNGALGEAVVSGTFSFPSVHFVKAYYGKHSVTYDGTMDGEGKQLSGSWRIPPTGKGTWIAWRIDDGEKFEETETVEEEERPLIQVSPA